MRKKRASQNVNNKKVIKIIKNTVFWLFLLIFLVASIYMISMKVQGKQPVIFGYKFYVVLTGSMEPNIKPGDMVIVKEVDINEISTGDIITFSNIEGKNITTHRVTNIEYGKGLEFTTKGDANNVEDEKRVSESQVLGKVTKNIKGLGTKIQYIKNNILIVVLVMTSIFLLICILSFIINRSKNDSNERINQVN